MPEPFPPTVTSRTAEHRPPEHRYVLVLSAGRTGSTFLDHLLKRLYPEVCVLAEREPARLLRTLDNIRLLEIPTLSEGARRMAQNWYLSSRLAWLRRLEPNRLLIEINPFLAGLGPDLAVLEAGPSLHMVRHPVAWVRSAVSFGSYSWRRPIVPFIPLARERPALAMRDWRQWSDVERFAWRWVVRNAAILDYAHARPPQMHRLCRYEDLFPQGTVNLEEARNVVAHLGLDPSRVTADTLSRDLVNPSHQRHAVTIDKAEEARIMKICGGTAASLGYG
jgi:hypothetical protein